VSSSRQSSEGQSEVIVSSAADSFCFQYVINKLRSAARAIRWARRSPRTTGEGRGRHEASGQSGGVRRAPEGDSVWVGSKEQSAYGGKAMQYRTFGQPIACYTDLMYGC